MNGKGKIQICSVIGCRNCTYDHKLYEFPTEHTKLDMWKVSMMRPNWKIYPNSKICQAHFEMRCFTSTGDLKPGALPTIFRPEEFNSKKTKFCCNANKILVEKEKEILALTEENDNLKRLVKSQANEINTLKKYESAIKKVFTENQIQNLCGQKRKLWTMDSVEMALKIKFSCGTSGYEFLLNQNYPLPSIRTLCMKMEHIKFSPGILSEIFEYLSIKITEMNEYERHCCVLLDEMSITPGKQYCTSTSTVYGLDTLSNDQEIANHCLVVQLVGISTRWKQVVAYHFTGASTSGECLVALLKEILNRAEAVGLNVLNVTTDMGSARVP